MATFRGLRSIIPQIMYCSLQSSKVTAIYAKCEGKSKLSDMKNKISSTSSINTLVPSDSIPFQLQVVVLTIILCYIAITKQSCHLRNSKKVLPESIFIMLFS